VLESVLSYGCESLSVDYGLKKKLLRTIMGFWRRAARSSRILKLKK
jgi:hypothetical protein